MWQDVLGWALDGDLGKKAKQVALGAMAALCVAWPHGFQVVVGAMMRHAEATAQQEFRSVMTTVLRQEHLIPHQP